MKKYLPLLISGLLMIFIGLYMILRPSGFLSVVISAFGIYLIIDGVRTLLGAYRLKDIFGKGIRSVSMGKALLNMIAGIVVIIIAVAAPSLIPTMLVYLVAAAFVITGIVDVIELVVLSRAEIPAASLGLETILSFVFAIIIYKIWHRKKIPPNDITKRALSLLNHRTLGLHCGSSFKNTIQVKNIRGTFTHNTCTQEKTIKFSEGLFDGRNSAHISCSKLVSNDIKLLIADFCKAYIIEEISRKKN